MDKQKFLQYIDHFNHKRYEEVMKFYDPEVVFEYPTMLANPQAPPVTRRGRAGFLEQYVNLHQHCREALEVGDFLLDGNRMAAEMYTEFHFFKDYANFSGRSMNAGDVYITTNWCIYTIENERFTRIRVAHFRLHDPKTARL
ncbi:MAG TPA: nuclear transport factor 2 family protein [Candidatus Acidoferrales bacterium]|nr:nuclear transport factor 2 family protein [Candidatus Acidoferrales bacterium]